MLNLVLTVFLLIGGFLLVTSTILLSNEQNDQYARELKMCIIALLATIVGCLVCLSWNCTVRYSECSEDSFTEKCIEQNVRP